MAIKEIVTDCVTFLQRMERRRFERFAQIAVVAIFLWRCVVLCVPTPPWANVNGSIIVASWYIQYFVRWRHSCIFSKPLTFLALIAKEIARDSNVALENLRW